MADNGATATAIAAAAQAQAAAAEDEAHRARCTIVLDRDPRPSVQTMQGFADCVEFMYPRNDGMPKPLVAVIVAATILGILGGIWTAWKEDRSVDPVAMSMMGGFGMIVGGLIGFGLALVVSGFHYVFF